MPYPVQPPAPPPIVYAVPEKKAVAADPIRVEHSIAKPEASPVAVEKPAIAPSLPIAAAENPVILAPEAAKQIPPVQFPPVEEPPLPPPFVRDTDPDSFRTAEPETDEPEVVEPPPLQDTPIEVTADNQKLDDDRQVFTASGNVVMRFRDSVLDADRLEVNLASRYAVAEGNVAFTRANEVIRGDRFEYNFAQETGTLYNARGELTSAPPAPPGAPPPPPTPVTGIPNRPLSDRVTANQPLGQVVNTGGLLFEVGGGRGFDAETGGGSLNNLRFEADRVDIYPRGWEASQVRMTNDPFSEPELEVRADRATYTRLSPLVEEIYLYDPRLRFEGGFSLPIPRRRIVIDRRQRDPGLFAIGFDNDDRGGLFIERSFRVLDINTNPAEGELPRYPQARITLTPQYYVQQAVDTGDPLGPSQFGLRGSANFDFTPTTNLGASITLTDLDIPNLNSEDDLRAQVQLSQLIPTPIGFHELSTRYNFRDRLFNGSLGFRTVYESFGVLLRSPDFLIGNTGIRASYELGHTFINADTDRIDLLAPLRENNRASLERTQASFTLRRPFLLWQGQRLDAPAREVLRYSPVPIVPFVALATELQGSASFYSNGDEQNALRGTVSLSGQFGHFSKPFLDYTAFNIGFTDSLQDGLSPYLFDRLVDQTVLTLGVTQQVAGPFRVGFQTAINLDNSEVVSTDYILEYSRRTYGIRLRFNPQREVGSLEFRISDFNWSGGTDPFSGPDPEARFVEGGVTR